MRKMQVAAAVVADPAGPAQRFLLAYNPKWKGYAFPMRDFHPDADPPQREAITALEADLGLRLPAARADETDYLGHFGVSGRSGEDTLYEYWAVAVDPGQPLDLAAAQAPDGRPPLFEDYAALLKRDDVTWTTKEIARHVVETQEAALAVVVRHGKNGPEYLLVWNGAYGGYFFPAARVRSEFKPAVAARRAVRSDLDYRGEAACAWKAEVHDVHYSSRYQCDRLYRFHVCATELPGVDLDQPGNALEAALTRAGRRWVWLTREEMAAPPQARPLSPTLAAVRATVWNAVPGA